MWKNYQNCHENKLCYSNYTLPTHVHCLTLNAPITLSLSVTTDKYFLSPQTKNTCLLLSLLCNTTHMSER